MSKIGPPDAAAWAREHDDRIVLPITRVREAASLLCNRLCHTRQRSLDLGETAPHDESCIVPDIEQRDRLMAETYTGTVSPDCYVGGVKCQACTGCLHPCHTSKEPT